VQIIRAFLFLQKLTMTRDELLRLINLSSEFIGTERPNRPGTIIRPTNITIHNTSNSRRGADAAAHSNFVRNTGYYILRDASGNEKKTWVSWHFSVDDHIAIRHLPSNEKAYHAHGEANDCSIAIEICMNEGINQEAANTRAAQLTALLCHDLSIPLSGVVTHKHWTGKNCPQLLLTNWDGFKQKIKTYLQQLSGGIETISSDEKFTAITTEPLCWTESTPEQADAGVSAPGFDFSGDVATHYEQCLGPLFFEPYAIEVAKRIDPSSISIALELASGTGRVTRHIRERIPASAKLIASDISQDMLAVAKERLKDLDIEWQMIDAQTIPFEDNSIDLVVCCFGFMFVPDKPKAFAEIYRVLRRGGTLLLTTWDRLELNGASYAYRTLANEYLQESNSDSYNLPFSMSDENMINGLMRDAGFSNISIEKVKQIARSETAKEAVSSLVQGGFLYNEIMKRNPAWIDEIKSRLEKELSEKFGSAPMIAPMSAIIGQGTKG
jgi:ubiquinone/menaquinone biosynthesis C-methylase UbiE